MPVLTVSAPAVIMPCGNTLLGILLALTGWDCTDENGFGAAALAVARQIAHYFRATGGVTDAHGVVQIALE